MNTRSPEFCETAKFIKSLKVPHNIMKMIISNDALGIKKANR